MTGAMLAQVLLSTQANLRIAIVEQSPLTANSNLATISAPNSASTGVPTAAPKAAQSAPANSFDSRSIALAAGSIELLQQWGLWSELAVHACAIQQIQVSDRGHFGKTYLNAAEFNRRSLGQVLEIDGLGALLYAKLAKFSGQGRLHWFRPDHIIQLEATPDYRQLQLASGQTLHTKLLIICEGGDSPTRQLAGMRFTQQSYEQAAVIANIGVLEPHQHIAFERFTEHGPIALLPLSRQRYSLVWTLPPLEAERVQQLGDAEFLQALQQAFGYRAGVLQSVGQRQVYPLLLKYCAEPSAHRLLLCGNSLHNLHPIAGQGFNLALRDIVAINELVGQHLADVGSYALCRAYQQLRQPDVAEVIGFTDTLVRLFSNNSKLMAFGRSLGLSALMGCEMLKTKFAHQSMGLSPILRQQQALRTLAASSSQMKD
ncbi:MAG: 2-octaprenyl-6-methoxyphenyl hydroxylase [Gammaproteobacteria bacterium]|nr:2-octaprenyl-6-methoxyphenyl hydroxylase [Gammaproteobacteria bacterium]MBU2425624.1 2-octaprenyl-6-methoxyphenyl hydroxylase [Gammaproteobacteria bacterium]